MNIERKRKRFLQEELKEYLKKTPMTKEEEAEVRQWVKDGHSVHENYALICDEDSMPVDFLDVYRAVTKVRQKLESMSYEEGSRYLRREFGIDRDAKPVPRPVYEELKEDASRLYRICSGYWDVLAEYNLAEIAHDYVAEFVDEELPFDLFDWDIDRERDPSRTPVKWFLQRKAEKTDPGKGTREGKNE